MTRTSRLGDTSIDSVALNLLSRLAAMPPYRRLIPFPVVFGRLCPWLCIKKAEAWALLRNLQASGVIRVVPFHGVHVYGDKD